MPATLIRLAYLIVEKTATDGTLISWCSLDDRTPRRMILPGIPLDPVWEEYDAPYFNSHGNYHFALSPRLGTPVTFTAPAVTLGPLDTAMVGAFIAALPTITANLQNSTAMAAHYIPQPSNPGDRAFYRFAADWSVDSDGDGRFDWQELVLDGNNPFTPDTDGDGVPDQPLKSAGSGPGVDPVTGLPLPNDPEALPPEATFERLFSHAHYHKLILPNHPTYTPEAYAGYNGITSPILAVTNTYAELQSAFYAMTPPEEWRGLISFDFHLYRTSPDSSDGYQNGGYANFYGTSHKSFRLHLDG